MALGLHNLGAPKGANKGKKRVGRGPGSGHGKTSTRGYKGQKSRSGYSRMRGFEGGQMPLHRRLPKRGFTNIFRKEYVVVNLGLLDRLEGDSFDPGKLLELGVIRKLKEGVKILGAGELKRKIQVKAHQFSKSALEKIQAAGGTAEVIGGEKTPTPAAKPPAAKPAAKPKAAETPKAEAGAEKPARKPRQPKATTKKEEK